jgi:hypothetical protein
VQWQRQSRDPLGPEDKTVTDNDSLARASAGGMTPKQRMIAALTGSYPDCLPAAPAYLSLFLADFERANYVDLYRLRLRGLDRYAVDHDEDTAFRAEAIYRSYGIFKTRPDWIEVHQGASRAWAAHTHIVRQGSALYYEDIESGVRLPMDSVPMPHGNARLSADGARRPSTTDLWDISGELHDAADVDARLPVSTAEELLGRGDFDLLRRMVTDYGDRYFISTILDTPYSDAYDLLGFQGLMLIQYDRPKVFHHLLERKLAQARPVMEACAACGVHGVYAEEVFTGADLISPRSYDEFVFAYNRPYFQHMRSLGLAAIHYVCGDTIPRLERMVQYDVAAIAVEESKKAFRIEIEDVVERVAGRCALFGNVDAVRFGQSAPLDEMEGEVRRQARIGARASGFVVSTGSPFPLDTNPRLIDTLVETAHSIGGGQTRTRVRAEQ